jgi:signal transduction histidine kinase
MHWTRQPQLRLEHNASQVAQLAWLAFAALALGLAVAGIPNYHRMLLMPCDRANCFDLQLTVEASQAWLASGQTLETYAFAQLAIQLLIDALLFTTAAFLIWRKANNRASVLAAFVETALATSRLSEALAHNEPQFWLPAQLIMFVQMAGLLPLFCLFPDGHFRPRAMAWVATAYVIFTIIYFVPQYREWLAAGTIGRALLLAFGLLSLLVVVATLFYRWRTAPTSTQQEQMLWLLAGMGLAALAVILGSPLRLMNFSVIPSEVLTPQMRTVILFVGMCLAVGSFTCLAVALFNYEPINTDVLINRSLVYGALTMFVVAVYGLTVGYLSSVFRSDNILFSLIATGFIAVLFQPLRERLQRRVNRLMYGQRDDPYEVLSRLGQQLETAVAPATLLASIVQTLVSTLKLPYAAITMKEGDTLRSVASVGQPVPAPLAFPLRHQNEVVGQLLAGPRAAGEPFSTADRRLIEQIARQSGVVMYSLQLTEELQSARERLVTAREEERRRLRRDLHDGLGPQLASQTLTLDAVSKLLTTDPAAAADLLRALKRQSQDAIGDIRRLVYDLRPPALDDLGLVAALREQTARYQHTGIRFTLSAPEPLPALSAAVEVAAYRIAQEALTNVARHSHAQTCQIALAMNSALHLTVVDDGCGLSADCRSGVGLHSMRERAEELGGACLVEQASQGGTRVYARLPLAREE